MGALVVGLLLFLGGHSVMIVAPDLRARAVARIGMPAWRGIYSVVSLAGLVLLVWGYGLARQDPVPLWDPPTWTRHLAATLMIFVFPLLLAAYLPGRIKAAAKHPMLAAVKVWALAHLLANGTLADLLLFGGFLAWAVAARISAKRHPRTDLPSAPARPLNDLIAVAGGLLLYGVFVLMAHEWLIGVAPLG